MIIWINALETFWIQQKIRIDKSVCPKCTSQKLELTNVCHKTCCGVCTSTIPTLCTCLVFAQPLLTSILSRFASPKMKLLALVRVYLFVPFYSVRSKWSAFNKTSAMARTKNLPTPNKVHLYVHHLKERRSFA